MTAAYASCIFCLSSCFGATDFVHLRAKLALQVMGGNLLVSLLAGFGDIFHVVYKVASWQHGFHMVPAMASQDVCRTAKEWIDIAWTRTQTPLLSCINSLKKQWRFMSEARKNPQSFAKCWRECHDRGVHFDPFCR